MIAYAAAAVFLSLVSGQAQPSSDGPIATVNRAETADAQRMREALAYARDLPPGAPTEDYPLVAWCEALVSGHVATGESLSQPDELDREIIRLGRLEAADFRTALDAAQDRATAAQKSAAQAAAADARAKWAPVLANADEAARSQVFGLFYGLPGRCEHAARRVRMNISSAPAALRDVGLDESGLPSGATR
jgi:hypothetical protein